MTTTLSSLSIVSKSAMATSEASWQFPSHVRSVAFTQDQFFSHLLSVTHSDNFFLYIFSHCVLLCLPFIKKHQLHWLVRASLALALVVSQCCCHGFTIKPSLPPSLPSSFTLSFAIPHMLFFLIFFSFYISTHSKLFPTYIAYFYIPKKYIFSL